MQKVVQRRLERQGWDVDPAVTIRAPREAFRCHVDLIARRSRRLLMIEIKPNWPPYSGIGQLIYYYHALKREGKSLPKDLVLVTWRRTEVWDAPLMDACNDADVRLWLFTGNYRAFTMKGVGRGWQYVPLDELAPPRN